jgi:hypothetical protein
MAIRYLSLLILALIVGVFEATVIAQSPAYYVAPNGNDSSSGLSPRQAFASLERARDVIRMHRPSYSSDTVFVYLLEGEYAIQRPFELEPDDSGTPVSPVVYTALPGNKVILNGGKKINGWRKYKSNIWEASLPELKNGAG